MSKKLPFQITSTLIDKFNDNAIDTELIELENIVLNSKNFYSIENIEELAETIKEYGLMQPIVVTEREEGKYTLLIGHRRYNAFLLLRETDYDKYNKIPAMVKNFDSEEDEELYLIYANSTARKYTAYEIMTEANRLLEIYKAKKERGEELEETQREFVSSQLNISKSQAYRNQRMNENLSEEAKNAFKEEKINFTEADKLAQQDKKTQNIILKKKSKDEKIDIKREIQKTVEKEKKKSEYVAEEIEKLFQESLSYMNEVEYLISSYEEKQIVYVDKKEYEDVLKKIENGFKKLIKILS